MRLSRTILSLSTMVIAVAGVSAFSADAPETAGAESAAPVAVLTNGERCLGADVGLEVRMAKGFETALQTDAVVAAIDHACLTADPALEAVVEVACAQPVKKGPPPSPVPEKRRCADLWDGDCFAGCCGPPGQVRKWVACCNALGGPCNPDCTTVCNQRYCSRGPR